MSALLTADVGNPTLNISIFAVFVIITLAIVIRVSRQNSTAADYFAGGRAFSGRQNGLAIAGDYLSAASFLGIAGAIAIYGYDGFVYSIGFLVAWLVALLVVAELLRNTGKFTMADVLSFRLRQGPVRTAAAISTLCVSFFYLLAQMAGAGGLVALLLGVKEDWAQTLTVIVVGILMITYVLVGGMKGTTWVQMIKAALLIIGSVIMAVWVMAKLNFNISEMLGQGYDRALADLNESGAEGAAASVQAMQEPGARWFPGGTFQEKINFVSLSMALVLGTAGLPHVLMRFYTVPTAKEARRSVVWAIWVIGAFYLLSLALGYGAMQLVGRNTILDAAGGANAAAPLLAYELGGEVLMGIISGVAFATILAVVAGLTIAASASFAHDVYNHVIKKGELSSDDEVKVARVTAIIIGIVAIAGGVFALQAKLNIAFLVALAFAVAASANLPTILYSLFWKGFTTQGAVASIYGGLISAIGLIIFSDTVTGTEKSMFPDVAINWFPLTQPGIISIPLGFLLGYVVSKMTAQDVDVAKAAEMEVRSLTGAGSEKVALDH